MATYKEGTTTARAAALRATWEVTVTILPSLDDYTISERGIRGIMGPPRVPALDGGVEQKSGLSFFTTVTTVVPVTDTPGTFVEGIFAKGPTKFFVRADPVGCLDATPVGPPVPAGGRLDVAGLRVVSSVGWSVWCGCSRVCGDGVGGCVGAPPVKRIYVAFIGGVVAGNLLDVGAPREGTYKR